MQAVQPLTSRLMLQPPSVKSYEWRTLNHRYHRTFFDMSLSHPKSTHLGPEEAQVAQLEVGPEMAQVVVHAARGHKIKHVVLGDELRPRAHEALRLRPERRDGGRPLQHRNGEPVLDAPEQ